MAKLAVENERRQDEGILRPLARAHRFEEGEQHINIISQVLFLLLFNSQ
jgi:hypothetical protein